MIQANPSQWGRRSASIRKAEPVEQKVERLERRVQAMTECLEILTGNKPKPIIIGKGHKEEIARFEQACGLDRGQIYLRTKSKRISHPRQDCFVHLQAAFPDLSLPDIGRLFGLDHTTVLHGIRASKARAATARGEG